MSDENRPVTRGKERQMSQKYDRDVKKSKRQAAWEEARCAKRRRLEFIFAEFCGRNTPPGMYWERELKWLRGGMIASVSLTFIAFLVRCLITVGNLYESKWVPRGDGSFVKTGFGLKYGAMMPPVTEVLDGNRTGFVLVAVVLVAFAVNHYRYYRQESMSVYLMKRLPDRWEYHRRNLALPVTSLVVLLVTMVLLELVCFGVYLLMTPAGCLPKGQWTVFWMWMIGGGL